VTIAVRTLVFVYKQTDLVIFCRVVMIIVATGIYRIFVCENGLIVMEKSLSLTLFNKKSASLII